MLAELLQHSASDSRRTVFSQESQYLPAPLINVPINLSSRDTRVSEQRETEPSWGRVGLISESRAFNALRERFIIQTMWLPDYLVLYNALHVCILLLKVLVMGLEAQCNNILYDTPLD